MDSSDDYCDCDDDDGIFQYSLRLSLFRHPRCPKDAETKIVYKRRGLGGLPPSRLTKSRAGSIASSGAGDDSNASGLMPASALAGSGNGDDSSLDGTGTEDTM